VLTLPLTPLSIFSCLLFLPFAIIPLAAMPPFFPHFFCCRHLQVGCRDSGATFMRHMATAVVCAAHHALCCFRELSPAHHHMKHATAPHTGHTQACRHQAMQIYVAVVHFEET